ncbi:MAG: TauD/TfdA dioxygenase family protein, partial [Litorivicinaceae bacterium]
MNISPLAPAIGGRVDGCDLTQSLNSSHVKQIQDAFLEHAVLLFPGQNLAHQDQLNAAQIFGESGTLHRPREFQPKAYDSLPDGIMMISN